MTELRHNLAKLLLEKSYKEGHFTLTSGRTSDYYFDCKQTALHPYGSFLIGSLFLELIPDSEIAGVGGMTLGADPLVSAVTVLSYTQNRPLPGFIIRKKPKGHGTDQYLEGMANFSQGDKIILLEDVVTTGKTLIQSIERVKANNLEISGILSVLDRQEGGGENLNKHGYQLNSIFTRSQLLEEARG